MTHDDWVRFWALSLSTITSLALIGLLAVAVIHWTSR